MATRISIPFIPRSSIQATKFFDAESSRLWLIVSTERTDRTDLNHIRDCQNKIKAILLLKGQLKIPDQVENEQRRKFVNQQNIIQNEGITYQ